MGESRRQNSASTSRMKSRGAAPPRWRAGVPRGQRSPAVPSVTPALGAGPQPLALCVLMEGRFHCQLHTS